MYSEKYCKDIVKKSGSSFYYSFFFLPRRKKKAMYAIYAFSRVIDDIVDGDSPLSSKERLLTFWRSEIDQCFSGTSEHPLTEELIYATKEFGIPKEYLLELLQGVTQDMVQNRYATFDDLKKYCYRVASVVGLICLKIFEVEDNEKNRRAAIDLGWAFQLTNILRDVSADVDINRIYLPEEDILRFGLTEEAILNKKYSKEFVGLMAFEWERARSFFDRAWLGFDRESSKKLLPAMIMAEIYYKILLRIKEIDYDVFKHRIKISTFKKIQLALKRSFV